MPEPSADVVIRAQGLAKSFLIGSKAEKESSLETTHRLLTGAGSRRVLWALRHLDLEVNRGETLGIIGPNGAGKSTLLLLLARILAPSEGRLEVSGKTDQFFGLDEGLQSQLTVRENMSLCAALLGMPPEVFAARLPAMLDFSKLHDYLYAKFGELSTGLAARVAFSVAIHGDLDIILVDEKLAVGDGAFQDKCLSVFRDFQKQGKTLLIVSHSLQLIDRLCPRTLYLNAGRTAFLGDTTEAIRLFVKECGGASPEPRPLMRRAEPPQAEPALAPAAVLPPAPVPSPAPVLPPVADPDALLEEIRDGVRAELKRDRADQSADLSQRLDQAVGEITDRLEAFKAGTSAALLKRFDHAMGQLADRLEELRLAGLKTAAEKLTQGQTVFLDAHWEERSAAFAKKLDEAVARLTGEIEGIQSSWLQNGSRQKASLDSEWEQRSTDFVKKLDHAVGQLADRIEGLRADWQQTLAEVAAAAPEAPSLAAAGKPADVASTLRGLRRQPIEEEVLRAWPAALRHTGPLDVCGSFNDAFLFLLCQLTAPASGPRLRPGDEVITTAANMPIAGYLPAFGLVPVFVDLDPATYNLGLSQLKKALGPASRAVLATCLAGGTPDLERLRAFCDEHKLLLIECAPHYLGCRCGTRMVGTWGDVGCGSTGGPSDSPETWALALARPELGDIFAQKAPRPDNLPFILHHPAPVTALGLSLALEASRGLGDAAKRRKAAVAELRAFCASYPDLLTLPELHAQFSADAESFTAIVKETAPFSAAELAAALAAASVGLLPIDIRINAQMKRVYGLEARVISDLPNTGLLLSRGLNIAVDNQDGAEVCAALARFVHAQGLRR
ncbi:MAG: DegT/DnrJ/EryC1/StrS family aminotransferase [Elusimicrobia bacterium]|nr:DegT/DnrJ/EryC1/StrS family aminotransferase [Elusimicrobiota bacterium]